MTNKEKKAFQREIISYFNTNKRVFPWRNTQDPYKILVSEVMLQQTGCGRVVPKYTAFIEVFPTIESLAQARLKDVLEAWQGLGYNRRAKALHESAKMIVMRHNSQVPEAREDLEALPGIGPYTAGATRTFAFNKPDVFIETNIRTVFIHFFFSGENAVHDKNILPLIEETVDHDAPRKWFFALMDYGAWIKATHGNVSQKSVHYARQSAFKGSDREIRGKIIKLLVEEGWLTEKNIVQKLNFEAKRIGGILKRLLDEALIKERRGIFRLS